MGRPTDWHVLDLPADPTPGDVQRVRELARRTRTIADNAEGAASNVRGLAGDQATMTWIGAAGDVFKDAIGKFPGQLDKVATSHHMAADALDGYATDLSHAQDQADRALSQARDVYDKVQSLHGQLATATGTLDSLNKPGTPPEPPDPQQVKEQARKHTAAQAQVDSLTSQLSGPQAQLEAAKKLAGQAAALRDGAADTASRKLHDAANAGIPPDSFWHKLGDIAAKVWHGLITVAKIVVAVGGIIALIIGGPIAWIVFAAALLVLADTIYKYTQGQASLWDVALAALSCIPMTKGLTTLAELRTAFQEGGLIGAGVHILGAGWGAIKGMGTAAKALWEGRAALPGLMRALPFTAWGKLTSMATELRYGAIGGLTGFGAGFGDGAGFFGSLRNGFSEMSQGWRGGRQAADLLPSQAARAWQGSGGYPGIDLWHDTTLPAGTDLEALHPKLTGFVMPDGTVASLGGDSAEISRGVQVGPSDLNAFIEHNYRVEAVNLHVNSDIPAASSRAVANPQFGGGGLPQHFIPGLDAHLSSGAVTVVDAAGHTLPVSGGFVDLSGGGRIPLSNFDLAPGSHILTNNATAATAKGGVTIVTGLTRTGVTGANVTAPSR
ncbi:WXG100 family type VII secretion target [Streptomyces sp. NPDC020917]|uniref:WXG100 family type VII secretion target n=1 Tax=Streptomyces sp. NPDC020917 TaxID=3365102 RepID=UPI0037B4C824